MSAAERRRRYDLLRDRVREVARLGDPVPRVEVDVAELLVDLLLELRKAVRELELHERPA